MKSIDNWRVLKRARNAEHYQAHEDILAAITPEFATAQGLAKLRENYASLFAVEDNCYLRNRSFEDTPEINAADQKRDDIFLYISQIISANLYCPIEEYKQAAARLDFVLDPYRGASRLPLAQNTAAVSDFLKKIQEEAYAADVTKLALSTSIEALAEANAEFNQLYTARSEELLTRASSETMKTIRPKVDAAFKDLATAINSLYNVNALVTQDESKEESLGAVIDKVNAILLQLQTTLSRAGVGSKPQTGPEEGGDPVPETPEEPDDKPTTGEEEEEEGGSGGPQIQ